MKKTDLRQRTDPNCNDDALEVKNAMLMTALLAEEQNHKESVVTDSVNQIGKSNK
jgi:hypothetical protein